MKHGSGFVLEGQVTLVESFPLLAARPQTSSPLDKSPTTRLGLS